MNRKTTYKLGADYSPTGKEISLEELKAIDPNGFVSWEDGGVKTVSLSAINSQESPIYKGNNSHGVQMDFVWADTLKEIEVADFPGLLGENLVSLTHKSEWATIDIALIKIDTGELKAFVCYQEYGSSSCRFLHCQPDGQDELEDLVGWAKTFLIEPKGELILKVVDDRIHPYREFNRPGEVEKVPWVDEQHQELFVNSGYEFIQKANSLGFSL